MELQVLPDRYDGAGAMPYVEAANLRREGDRICIQAPLGDDEDFAIHFPGDSLALGEALLDAARSLLQALGRLDNTIQEAWVEECRSSGLHPGNFEGELAYVELSERAARLHYVGSRVNTEWDEEVVFEDGRWLTPGA